MDQPATGNKNKLNLHVRLDYRIISAALLVVVAVMLVAWKPWAATPTTKDRTITVTGESTLKASPDEFVFSPSYEFTNTDKDAALKAVSDKSKEVIAGLKKLGVSDKQIQTNANVWSYPRLEGNNGTPTYTLTLTVTLDDSKKALTQKVQDYLLTTSPTGALTPSASFSETKKKSLQVSARDKATQDARSKADQSAKNLGFSIRSVKSVDDANDFSGLYPTYNGASMESDKATSIAVQPGESTIHYSVTVTYYIK